MPASAQGVLGLVVFVAFSWLISEQRRAVNWRIPVVGVAVQLALALALIKLPGARALFEALNDAILALDQATQAGTSFVFGYLGGDQPPFEVTNQGQLYILAFRGLPLVLVISALTSLLIYWRILPRIVQGFAWLFRKSLGIGGALGLGVAGNIFVGMVESPLLIRSWLERLTRSELFALMACGMATIAGTMMALYATVLGGVLDNAMGHILTASVISAPAAVTVARIMVPETGEPTDGDFEPERGASSAMDAITRGTLSGLELLLNIIAMLIVLIALVHVVNAVLGLFPAVAGDPITLERILGLVMAPVTWLMGLPWSEAVTAGELMGIKVVINELVAYVRLSELAPEALSARSELIMTYAMCGFANFGSLGTMIGGLGSLVPSRRNEVISLGMKSILAGVIATCMTGAVIGLVW